MLCTNDEKKNPFGLIIYIMSELDEIYENS